MKWGDVVPQFFFDVIGRLVPGLLLMGVIHVLWPGSGHPFDLGSPGDRVLAPSLSWGRVIGLGLAAYLLSTVLEGVWDIPDMWSRQVNHRGWGWGMDETPGTDAVETGDPGCGEPDPVAARSWRTSLARVLHGPWKRWMQTGLSCILYSPWKPRFSEIKVMIMQDWEKYSTRMEPLETALMYDMLRFRSPAVGARVVKLRAECYAYRRLITGWMISFFVILAWHIRDTIHAWLHPGPMQHAHWLLSEGALLGLWLLTVGVCLRREEQFYWSLCNNWLIVEESARQLAAKPSPSGP